MTRAPSGEPWKFWWGWFILLLFGCTVAASSWFQLAAAFTAGPVVLDVLTEHPATPQDGLNLSDGRQLIQTLRVPDTTVRHLAIGAANLRGAASSAVMRVRVGDDQDRPLSETTILVSALRADDVTRIPAGLQVVPGARLHLSLTTHGVPRERALTVFYQVNAQSFPDGDARLVQPDGSTQDLTGNLRVQLLRPPTAQTVTQALLARTTAVPLSALALVLVGLLAPPVRRRLLPLVRQPKSDDRPPVRWREAGVAVFVGIVLAFTATSAYYTSLGKITTMGDVHRALVYRALGRDALLHDAEIARWDPYLCGGVPLLGNAESAHLDPFFFLVLFFRENLGVRLSVTATLTIGFVGAYFLARSFASAAHLPALLAGAVFAFSGFPMLAFANGNYAWIPFGWIPWFLLFVWESLRVPNRLVLAALTFSFMFLGGSVHMSLYALIAAALLFGGVSLAERTARPLVVLLLAVMLATSLSAVKLLPVRETQVLSAGYRRPGAFIPPLSWAPKMFWDRNQLATSQWTFAETGENFRWIEYGSYIGLLPILIALAGLPFLLREKRSWVLIGSGGVLCAMTFGLFPWTVLRKLPFLDEILRNPQRARVVLVLVIGVLAARSLTVLLPRVTSRSWMRTLAAAALVIPVLIDLATFHRSLYPRLHSLDQPALPRHERFVRVRDSYTAEDAGYYRVGYMNYLANEGTTDLCVPYMVKRGISARGIDTSDPTRPYQGETFLEQGGKTELLRVRPNHLTVSLAPEREGWLILNQNFFPGWHVSPSREIGERDGRLAVRVLPTDRELYLTFTPLSYRAGRLLTIVALALSLALMFTRSGRATREL